MSLVRKLQIKDDHAVALVAVPAEVTIDLPVDGVVANAQEADVVVVFVRDRAELDQRGDVIVEAATRDALAWVAYPKGNQLGTDLNRDRLAAALMERDIRAVRQISIDDVWSALRFRPAGTG